MSSTHCSTVRAGPVGGPGTAASRAVPAADGPVSPVAARYWSGGAGRALLVLARWHALRGLWDESTLAISRCFLGVVLFLTAENVVIAVDERFTTPALPLVGVFAGVRRRSPPLRPALLIHAGASHPGIRRL